MKIREIRRALILDAFTRHGGSKGINMYSFHEN